MEIAKRWEDAFTRYDWDALDDLITADFEWFPALPGVIEGNGYRGHDGFATYARELEETWEDLIVLVDEFRDLGDRALSLGRMEGRGRGSGVVVGTPVGQIYEFRGEKLARIRVFLSHSAALRAAGLSE